MKSTIVAVIISGLLAWSHVALAVDEKMNLLESLVLYDSNREAVGYKDVSGERGAVLLFVRSADWCPYCKKQLTEWQQVTDQVAERGYRIVGVSYDTPDVLMDFAKVRGITYTLLSDKDSRMIKMLGILNEDHEQGSRFYGIPNPTTLVVDSEGVISHIFHEEGYKNRPKIEDVLMALE